MELKRTLMTFLAALCVASVIAADSMVQSPGSVAREYRLDFSGTAAPRTDYAYAVGDTVRIILPGPHEASLELVEKLPAGIGGASFLAKVDGESAVRSAVLVTSAEGLRITAEDPVTHVKYTVFTGPDGKANVRSVRPGEMKRHRHLPSVTPPDRPSRSNADAAAVDRIRAAADMGYPVNVDILVAYDDEAWWWVKENGGMTNFAMAAVAKMNAALANTGLRSNFRFRLVGVIGVEASFGWDSFDQTLSAVRYGEKDSWGRDFSPIRAMRESCGADIVTTFIRNDFWAEDSVTGLGYSLDDKYSSVSDFSESAYNVCAIESVDLTHTMTHEVGHNMGCGHSDLQKTQPGPQRAPYSCGYYFMVGGGRYHTIMAYDWDGENVWKELPYFSSPDYKYEGVAVGNAIHDNTRVLRENFMAVSAFRAEKTAEIMIGEDTGPNPEWYTTRTEALAAAKAAGKRVLLVSGRDSCGYTTATRGYINRNEDVRRIIGSGFVCWYDDIDNVRGFEKYMSGTGTLPFMAVIDPVTDKALETRKGLPTVDELIAFLRRNYNVPHYTVRFDANGGSGAISDMVLEMDDDKARMPDGSAYKRAGYTFKGWMNDKGDQVPKGYPVISLSLASGSVTTFRAVWSPITYTVLFGANGGKTDVPMPPMPMEYGTPVVLPACTFASEDSGLSFGGWALTVDGLPVYEDRATVSNLTEQQGATLMLYAYWSKRIYTITFDANGGLGTMSAIKAPYLEAFTFPKCGFKTSNPGFGFGGWSDTPDGKVLYEDGATVTDRTKGENAELKFYAVWTPKSYSVAFDANGGTGTMPTVKNILCGTPSALPACAFKPVSKGISFAGWATSPDGPVVYADGGSVLDLTTEHNATVTLYAVWLANAYTLKFDANGGTGTMPAMTLFCGKSTNLVTCAFTAPDIGLAFAGWATNATGEAVFEDGAPVLDLAVESGVVVPLYATWKPKEYTVEFDPNGGEGDMAPMAFVYGEEQALATNRFTRRGYDFGNWIGPSGSATHGLEYADGQVVSNLTDVADAVVTFRAVWSPHVYTVLFDANGGSGTMEELECEYGTPKYLPTSTFTPPDPSEDGKTVVLAGWAFEPDGDVVYAAGTSVQDLTDVDGGSVTLYAKWTENVIPQCLVIPLGEYCDLDLVDDLGVMIDDVEYGDKVAVKIETLPKGLKFVVDKRSGNYRVVGTPVEVLDFETSPAYVRVSITKRVGSKNVKTETVQRLLLAVEPDVSSEYAVGDDLRGENAVPVDDDVTSVSGLPSGLKFSRKGEYPNISGVPKKAGYYVLTFTHKMDGVTEKHTECWQIDSDVYNPGVGARDIDWDAGKARWDDRTATATIMQGAKVEIPVNLNDLESSAKITCSGLPSGLKFNAKAGSISGTAKSAETKVVTFKTVQNGITVTTRFAITVETNPILGTYHAFFTEGGENGRVATAVATVSAGSAKVVYDEYVPSRGKSVKYTLNAKGGFDVDSDGVIRMSFPLKADPRNNPDFAREARTLILVFSLDSHPGDVTEKRCDVYVLRDNFDYISAPAAKTVTDADIQELIGAGYFLNLSDVITQSVSVYDEESGASEQIGFFSATLDKKKPQYGVKCRMKDGSAVSTILPLTWQFDWTDPNDGGGLVCRAAPFLIRTKKGKVYLAVFDSISGFRIFEAERELPVVFTMKPWRGGVPGTAAEVLDDRTDCWLEIDPDQWGAVNPTDAPSFMLRLNGGDLAKAKIDVYAPGQDEGYKPIKTVPVSKLTAASGYIFKFGFRWSAKDGGDDGNYNFEFIPTDVATESGMTYRVFDGRCDVKRGSSLVSYSAGIVSTLP